MQLVSLSALRSARHMEHYHDLCNVLGNARRQPRVHAGAAKLIPLPS